MDGIEKASLTWRTLTDWLYAQIDEMHLQNESAQLTADETLALRTRIFTMREIIALPEPPRPLTAESVGFDAR